MHLIIALLVACVCIVGLVKLTNRLMSLHKPAPKARAEASRFPAFYKFWGTTFKFGDFLIKFTRESHSGYLFLSLDRLDFGDMKHDFVKANAKRHGVLNYLLNNGQISELHYMRDLLALKEECLLLTARHHGGEAFVKVFKTVIARQPVTIVMQEDEVAVSHVAYPALATAAR